MLPLALDGVLAVLLVLSLALGFKLHSALRRLRNDNTDFDRLIGALDAATNRARSVLEGLKGTAGAAGERLSGDVGQAQRLLDELRFLCERGERLADGLAGQIESGRRSPPPVRATAAARNPPVPIWSTRSGPCDEPPLALAAAAAWARIPPGRASARAAYAIALVAAAKIALLAQDAMRTLAGPAVLEARALAGRSSARADLEPAAGPREPAPAAPAAEPESDHPAPQAGAARPMAGAVRRLALDRLSQSEVEILHQLAERRAALDRREQQLDRHAALLATAEASLAAQLERLERLRAEIATTIAAHDAKEEAKLASLVKIYETMKPKAAAEIFNRLEMPLLIRVVERMRAPKSADVLARMDPVKAKQVTAELARRTELLHAAGNG